MMSSGWQTGKPSTSTCRAQASSKRSIPSGANTRSRSNGPLRSWTKSLPSSISWPCASVRGKPRSPSAATMALPLSADLSRNRSASCVVSGYPSRIAPDLPMNRYRTPRSEKALRISSAWRYSNAPIAEPRRQGSLAPVAVLGHRVERAEQPLVESWLVRVDERVPHPEGKRSPGRRLEVRQPVCRNVGRRPHVAIIPCLKVHAPPRVSWPLERDNSTLPEVAASEVRRDFRQRVLQASCFRLVHVFPQIADLGDADGHRPQREGPRPYLAAFELLPGAG